jgi:large subunit ribosomal protein L21
MYAIVKSGGKQYRVERGQRLLVERLAVEEGVSVALEPLLYRSEEAVFDKGGLEKVKVTAKVLAHVRGEKLRVFKFKPKRGYRRRTGHRQELTRIEITEIMAQRAGTAARSSRVKRVDVPSETPKAKATRTPKAKTTPTPGAKTPEDAEAKTAQTAKAQITDTPKAKPGTSRAKATPTPKAKTETSRAKPTDTPEAAGMDTPKSKAKGKDGS